MSAPNIGGHGGLKIGKANLPTISHFPHPLCGLLYLGLGRCKKKSFSRFTATLFR